jgi:hypothetical protein
MPGITRRLLDYAKDRFAFLRILKGKDYATLGASIGTPSVCSWLGFSPFLPPRPGAQTALTAAVETVIFVGCMGVGARQLKWLRFFKWSFLAAFFPFFIAYWMLYLDSTRVLPLSHQRVVVGWEYRDSFVDHWNELYGGAEDDLDKAIGDKKEKLSAIYTRCSLNGARSFFWLTWFGVLFCLMCSVAAHLRLEEDRLKRSAAQTRRHQATIEPEEPREHE